jgi:hypothetical protein
VLPFCGPPSDRPKRVFPHEGFLSVRAEVDEAGWLRRSWTFFAGPCRSRQAEVNDWRGFPSEGRAAARSAAVSAMPRSVVWRRAIEGWGMRSAVRDGKAEASFRTPGLRPLARPSHKSPLPRYPATPLPRYPRPAGTPRSARAALFPKVIRRLRKCGRERPSNPPGGSGGTLR